MLVEIVDEAVVLFFVCKKPGPVGSFIEDLISILLALPTEYRIFVIGDFNSSIIAQKSSNAYWPMTTNSSPSAVTFCCAHIMEVY